ncbi:Beta-barrel assembly-enhancing protease [bacterium HR33]|nr:Beta-barrel assembly-enhancing protease [bacterium HR33]
MLHELISRGALTALLCSAPLALGSVSKAQSSVDTQMAKADSAFAAGDLEAARTAYAAVLERNGDQSRAVFRMGQLSDSPHRALEWYLRYVQLEPGDPWGYMAVGDVLGSLGRVEEGLEWYDRAAALAPGERDVAVGKARLLARAELRQRAIQAYLRWLDQHPEDAEVWEEIGREWLRAGRPRRAAAAFEKAHSLEPSSRTAARLAAARAQAAPAGLLAFGYSRDSDGNVTRSLNLGGDLMAGDGARVRLNLGTAGIEDGLNTAANRTAFFSASWRPRPSWSLEASAGLTQLESSASPLQPAPAPMLRVRARWTAPRKGPRVDLRASHSAFGYSPDLTANRVVRTELEGRLDFPLGPLRVKGSSRGTLISSRTDSNTRGAVAAGLGVPLPGGIELMTMYHRTGYRDSTLAGYFAPRLAEVAELGSYWEAEGARFMLALDLGAGLQRVARHGSPAGSWRPAFRLYSLIHWYLAPGRHLGLELEGYDSQIAPQGLPSAESWRYGSVSFSVRWAI